MARRLPLAFAFAAFAFTARERESSGYPGGAEGVGETRRKISPPDRIITITSRSVVRSPADLPTNFLNELAARRNLRKRFLRSEDPAEFPGSR